ncbi:unannotated protein [freshwater metagenome]|uniref:Unannotated protein n=1 Tax=freshwater metagenome TaxID=449393 RepID=A0A6J6IE61_9ZZZZ|nr:hypothetical protein [Actinomycetota bacterium]MSY39305.1 hypothetical protein [Actinomycetota bacterium]MSZ41555.1 hypothetical protein [Actinomycetota bacterium]
MTQFLRSLAAIGAGLLVGLIGAFVQADRFVINVPWGLLVVPWGMVLVIVVLAFVIRGGAWFVMSRWGAMSAFLGWILATVVMAGESPSGDLALSGGGRQWVYLLGGVVIGAAAMTFPVLSDRNDVFEDAQAI